MDLFQDKNGLESEITFNHQEPPISKSNSQINLQIEIQQRISEVRSKLAHKRHGTTRYSDFKIPG
jgi:hypothetical protein